MNRALVSRDAVPGRRTVRDDAGVATVFTCICVLVLLAVAVMAAQFGAAVLARHRAEIAADLGAIAGAWHVLDDAHEACGYAEAVATANGATLDTCEARGSDLVLAVTVTVSIGPLHGAAHGRARAALVAAPTQ